MPAVLLIDDHEIIHRGIAGLLQQAMPGCKLVCAASADEALRQIDNLPFDVVVVDLNIPGRGGLDLVKEIKRLTPNTPVLVHSMHGEDQFGVAVARAGAQGYLSKAEPAEKMVEALKTLLSGRPYFSQKLYEKLAMIAS